MKKITRFLTAAAAILLLALVFISCGKKDKNKKEESTTTKDPSQQTTAVVTDQPIVLTMNKTKMMLETGKKEKLTVISSQTGMETSNVLWETDNGMVATVDTTGSVTAISTGEAHITASTIDGKSRVTCTVEVVTSAKFAVDFNIKELSLNAGDTNVTIPFTVTGAVDYEIEWDVTQPTGSNVISVNTKNGLITANEEGTAYVYLKVKDSKGQSAFTYCTVHVKVPVKGIIGLLSEQTLTLTQNMDYPSRSVYKVTPDNASDPSVIWTFSDPKVAERRSDGALYAKGVGMTKVTLETVDGGYKYSFYIEVVVDPTGVVIEGDSIVTVTDGQTAQKELKINFYATSMLTARILPEGATSTSLVWTSSVPSVVSVSNGFIVGKSVGTAQITVSIEGTSISDTVNVTVCNPVTALTFLQTENKIELGAPADFPAYTYMPSNADNIADMVWESSDPAIIDVVEGQLVPVAPGFAVLTVTVGDLVQTVNVEVFDPEQVVVPVESLQVGSTLALDVGAKAVLNVTVKPANATNRAYSLTSANPDVVEVLEDGTLHALDAGFAIITVSSDDDPAKTATVLVVVNALTQQKIDKLIGEYQEKMEDEKKRHEDKLEEIEKKYATDLMNYESALAISEDELIRSLYEQMLLNKNNEIDAENKLNGETLAALEFDYAHIIPLIPELQPES